MDWRQIWQIAVDPDPLPNEEGYKETAEERLGDALYMIMLIGGLLILTALVVGAIVIAINVL
jgi:hypothetical protein